MTDQPAQNQEIEEFIVALASPLPYLKSIADLDDDIKAALYQQAAIAIEWGSKIAVYETGLARFKWATPVESKADCELQFKLACGAILIKLGATLEDKQSIVLNVVTGLAATFFAKKVGRWMAS